MVRLVLFDIDGTLLHTNSVGIRAFARTLESEFNVPNGTEGLKFAGRTDTGLVRELFLKHGIEPCAKNFQHFFNTYSKWLEPMLSETGGEVCPGAWPLIRELQALPKPPALGLLTGNIGRGAEIKLRHFKLWDIFVTGAFAEDSEDRNQIAAVALQRGAEYLGEPLRGEQVIVIGDTSLDVACGRAIGAKVLAVATGGAPLAELESLKPEWAVPNLTKISAGEICA